MSSIGPEQLKAAADQLRSLGCLTAAQIQQAFLLTLPKTLEAGKGPTGTYHGRQFVQRLWISCGAS